jgi:hypothetical protein
MVVLCAAMILVVGCGKPDDQRRSAKVGATPAANKSKHDGWWCDEHGIPEKECSACMSAADQKKLFKDKGDWCDKHDIAKSQCFACDPSLREKYAARYRAKYGKEPPPPEDNMPKEEPKQGGVAKDGKQDEQK